MRARPVCILASLVFVLGRGRWRSSIGERERELSQSERRTREVEKHVSSHLERASSARECACPTPRRSPWIVVEFSGAHPPGKVKTE